MAPQHPRSFARQLLGDLTPGYPGTGPLAGGDPPRLWGCSSMGCQQPLPTGPRSGCHLVTSPWQHLCLERSTFSFPVESEGSLTRGTGQGREPTSPLRPRVPPSIPALQTGSSRPGRLPCWGDDFNIATAFPISVCSTPGVSRSRRILAPLGWLLKSVLFPPFATQWR